MLDYSKFRFGIEHEFPCVDASGKFVDFTTATFEDLDRVIESLPTFDSDRDSLRVGDLGIKSKRWYIEGFERFGENGEYLHTVPKGFEIRTPICGTIEETVDTLTEDIERWERAARPFGYEARRCALNPFQTAFVPEPALNEWEVAARSTPEERTAHIHMLTYGPDISISHPDLTPEETIDIARKLTYYSPYVVPYSFTSPFYDGDKWGGSSRRTFYRTGERPAVLVFTDRADLIVESDPSLVEPARIPSEAGRIEFKAFDCIPAVPMYKALTALLVGLAMDTSLPGRATVPDTSLHQLAAQEAFHSEEIHRGAAEVLRAAMAALPEENRRLLAPLEGMLTTRMNFAEAMVAEYDREVAGGSTPEQAILEALR